MKQGIEVMDILTSIRRIGGGFLPDVIKTWIRRAYFARKGIVAPQPLHINWDLEVERPVYIGSDTIVECGVTIGRYSYINSGYIFSRTKIGRFCSFGWNVTIGAPEHPTDWLSTHPFQYGNQSADDSSFFDGESKSTFIGNDVWICSNTFIKRGVSIGDGAIIGAGAVVVKDVPPYAVVGGVPAKIIKYRFSPQIIEKLRQLEWWSLPPQYIRKLPFNCVDLCIEELVRLKADSKGSM